MRPFDLDGEWNVPAIASSLLLLGAAASLVPLGFRLQPGIAAWLFSAMLVFAAVDEAAQIHETLEQSLDFDWNKLYLPGALVAAIVWCVLLSQIRRNRRASVLFVAGGVTWLASQVLELLQWDGDIEAPGYTPMMVGEELLEMSGTALLLLSALYAGRTVRRSDTQATGRRSLSADR